MANLYWIKGKKTGKICELSENDATYQILKRAISTAYHGVYRDLCETTWSWSEASASSLSAEMDNLNKLKVLFEGFTEEELDDVDM